MSISRRRLLAELIGGTALGSALRPLLASGNEGPGGEVRKAVPVRLDRNENAYGPSTQAIDSIRKHAGEVSRYPLDEETLCSALAKHHSVKPEQIVIGCGSSEVLRMAANAFLDPQSELILALPTFGLIGRYAKGKGAKITALPLRKDYSHDLGGALTQAETSRGLVYVCNPNNPTGTLTERKDIESFLRNLPRTFRAVIDEAYHHYAGGTGAYASFIDQPVDNPRVITVRTFSKIYGLAGMRVGYAVAATEDAQKMKDERLPFGVNHLGIAGAIAALGDQRCVIDCARKNADDRQEFMNQVNARMLRALNSHTNFVCLNVMRPGSEIVEHYRKNGVVLPAPIQGMPTYLRVSLGTPDEMREFWRIWDLLGSHSMKM
jgi:histidinol-phosphate aminotransferase